MPDLSKIRLWRNPASRLIRLNWVQGSPSGPWIKSRETVFSEEKMGTFIHNFLIQLWGVLLELSPWLLFGMFIAGALHVFLPKGFIHRRFGGRGFGDVAKASLLGVPLPLCSCGVIPAAIGLKKDGASNGAATGFLISTPQTGVDSILVSASFLGWPFAIFKVFSALIMGLVGGSLVNLVEKNHPPIPPPEISCSKNNGKKANLFVELFKFGFGNLLRDIYGWLLLGIIAAALIGTLIPPAYFSKFSWMQGLGGMVLMLVISVPLYVCATASVPIAAGLIHAGLPLGSALVFLMAGPATNAATIGTVYKAFGKKVTVVYLGTVICLSILLGWVFQSVLFVSMSETTHSHHEKSGVISILAALTLIGLLVSFAVSDLKRKSLRMISSRGDDKMQTEKLKVEGMTCPNCVAHVKRAVQSLKDISAVDVNLETGLVTVKGENLNVESILKSIQNAGYKVKL